jgi:hypothetical protein
MSFSSPAALGHLTIERNSAGETVGGVGPRRHGETWLLLVTNWDSGRLDFYRSDGDNLLSVETRFAPLRSWQFSVDGFGADSTIIDRGFIAPSACGSSWALDTTAPTTRPLRLYDFL